MKGIYWKESSAIVMVASQKELAQTIAVHG